MKTSINLRDDLAKLSDAELAERLKVGWTPTKPLACHPRDDIRSTPRCSIRFADRSATGAHIAS
jgi:hypothetical protein